MHSFQDVDNVDVRISQKEHQVDSTGKSMIIALPMLSIIATELYVTACIPMQVAKAVSLELTIILTHSGP
jgi:hypothetical protein